MPTSTEIGVKTHFLYGVNLLCTPDGMNCMSIQELTLRFDLGDAKRMGIGGSLEVYHVVLFSLKTGTISSKRFSALVSCEGSRGLGHDGVPRYHGRQIISFQKCTLISPITPLHAPGLGSTGVSFVLASACTLMLLLKGFAPAIRISKGEVVMRWTIHRQERRENGSNAAMWPEEVILIVSEGAPHKSGQKFDYFPQSSF
jgi:hypothetical protein